METRQRELKRIGVFAAVKTLFLVGAVGGLLCGLFQWLILSLVLWSGSRAGLQPGDFVPGLDQALGAGIGFLGVMLPMLGAVAGAVGGVVFGFILTVVYNMGAQFWGGLEFEFVEPVPEEAMPPRSVATSDTATPLPGTPGISPPVRTGDETESTDRPPPPGFE